MQKSRVILYTNGTIIPNDLALFDTLRRKRVVVNISNYPVAQETQEKLIDKLEQKEVSYRVADSNSWIDYGAVSNHGVCTEEMQRQFIRCFIPCKNLFSGCLYYCPRSGHDYNLVLIDRKPGEYVDILHNTTTRNRRESGSGCGIRREGLGAVYSGTVWLIMIPPASGRLIWSNGWRGHRRKRDRRKYG